MGTITLSRQYTMPQEEIRAGIENMGSELSEWLDVEYRWDINEVHFKRTGASGIIKISDDELQLTLKLGLMYKPFEKKIKSQIMEFVEHNIY